MVKLGSAMILTIFMSSVLLSSSACGGYQTHGGGQARFLRHLADGRRQS